MYDYKHRTILLYSAERLPKWEINYAIEVLADMTNCCYSVHNDMHDGYFLWMSAYRTGD